MINKYSGTFTAGVCETRKSIMRDWPGPGKGECLAGVVQEMSEERPVELGSEGEGSHGLWELQGQRPRGGTKLGGL